MRLTIQVKTRCKKESIESLGECKLLVRIHTPPIEGAANAKIIEMLSEYYQVPKSKIQILNGFKSKIKTIEVTKSNTDD